MNRKPVKKDVRQTKKRRVQTKKKRVARRTKRRCEEKNAKTRKIVFRHVDRPVCKVKQEIYNKVKHHLTSSRETARLTTRTTTL
jgi:hypothetical protein